MMTFCIGLLMGVSIVWLVYLKKQRELKLLDEEKQLLQQEKQIVVEFMHNMVEAVAEGSDRQRMFQRIIHAAILSTGAMSACIFERRADDTLKGIAVEGLFPPQRKLPTETATKLSTRTRYLEQILQSETFEMGEGLIGQVAKSRKALLIADAINDPRVIQHEDASLKVRSIIVAPVLFQGNLIAVLAVANPADGLAFNDTDFSLVESLAEQVGLAIHNSDAMALQIEKNKLDLDIELASNIQALLLPSSFPSTEQLEFAAHYKAAQKIGGDLYDVFPIDANRIGVAIADVSGKGISASILMAICQTHLRHLSKHSESPAAVLSAINREMQKSMRQDMFITIVYAIIDLKANCLTLARAGHELPFYFHCEGERMSVEQIRSTGMALGMVPPEIFNLTIEDTKICFEPGDALLLYTDGVTECINAKGEEFSGARLEALFKKCGVNSAQEIQQTIIQSVGQFSEKGNQGDDLTLITIKRRSRKA